jgi:hypothetical protein
MLFLIYEKSIKLLIIKFQTIKFHFKVHKIRMSSINNISLFVPHVYSNFTSAMVTEVFNGLHIGEVKSVDLIPKMGSDSKRYNAAYIHFTSWHDTKVAHDFQKRLLDPKQEVKVMYDHPWYWIVLENKGKKHMSGERKQTINIDSFNTPEKTVAPVLNITPNKIKKTKPYVKLPTPVNLEAAFEAECVNNGFTQDELDWLEEQVELDENLSAMTTDEYVKSLKDTNAMLHYQLAYFRNLYTIEHAKYQAVMETFKHLNNK